MAEQWDVLVREDAASIDAAEMDIGWHYDYHEQRWIDGHDHAHFDESRNAPDDFGPLRFCGADLRTCQQGEQS